MKRILAIACLIPLALCFALGHHEPISYHGSGSPLINIYESEDLSGPAYLEPLTTLTITRSAGPVCYADDSTNQDGNQYYTDCNLAFEAGANIAPYTP